jgi:hypothetical protein
MGHKRDEVVNSRADGLGGGGVADVDSALSPLLPFCMRR